MADGSAPAAKRRRGPGKPFPKGVSGNPGGKKPMDPDVKEALEKLTPRAVERLGQILDSHDEKVAVVAAKEVLDRNLGKAPQRVELDDTRALGSLEQLLDQLPQATAVLVAAMRAKK